MTAKLRILVAVDNSEYALVVADQASKIAAQQGADVTLVSVVELPFRTTEGGKADDESTSGEEREFHLLHANLISRYFGGRGTPVESRILRGDPAKQILECAEGMHADAIVLGSEGKGKVAAFLLGSVTERVAKQSRCSVLIAKAR